jgi:hypothetical protein
MLQYIPHDDQFFLCFFDSGSYFSHQAIILPSSLSSFMPNILPPILFNSFFPSKMFAGDGNVPIALSLGLLTVRIWLFS